MILLGIILLIIGLIATVPIIWWIGVILIIVGCVLAVLGRSGRPVGGRNHWY